MKAATASLARLVAAASPNPPGDETRVAAVVAEEAKALGLPEPEVHARDARRPNLIFRLGAGSPNLLLAAHTDTMPPGEIAAWRSDPYTLAATGRRLTGLGVADMKASIAATLYAAARILRAPEPEGTLTLVFSADEENGSADGMAWLAQEGMLTADAGVATEPSSLGTESWESLFIAQRGSSVWSLAARGEPGHSAAQVPHERRASWAFARALTALLDAPLFEEHVHPVDETRSTVNVATMVGGGIVPFAHPEALLATIEVRTIEGMTKELVREELERCVRDAGLGDRVSVEAAPPPLDWLPPGETVRDERLLVAAKGAWRAVLASEPRLRVLPAGTDSSYLQAAGIPALPAFGPGSLAVAHRPNEWIPELDLIRAIDLFETLVRRYHRGGEGEVD